MEDVSRLCTLYSPMRMMCSRVASPMHAVHRNRQIEETIGVPTQDWGSTVAVSAVGDMAPIDRMSWTTQARQAPVAEGRGTRRYHLRIHDDQHS